MPKRPLAFGLRFRDRGRTVRVRSDARDPRRFVVEHARRGAATDRREHDSLPAALRDFAQVWRGRLH
jgi:hypothetical protein